MTELEGASRLAIAALVGAIRGLARPPAAPT